MSDLQPAVITEKSTKALRIALAVSVALNLAVVGVVAGTMLNHRSDDGRMETGRELGFGPFSEALGREDRRALRNAFLAKVPELRDNRRQRGEDTRALLAGRRADAFVRDALSALVEGQRHRMEMQLQLGQDLLRDLLIAMTPEARRAFADRLEQRLRPDRDATSAN